MPDNNGKQRFAFGKNWSRFLEVLNDERIAEAEKSLKDYFGVEHIRGKSFLDVGSGSGLFSLAARRLGARVRSFDYDADSVACTAELRRRYFPDDSLWIVGTGDALDAAWLSTLGRFDIVYSWGVLHHTGEMWRALDNVGALVAPDGKLLIGIYNDQGRMSHAWKLIKKTYNQIPSALRFVVLLPSLAALWGPATLRDFAIAKPLRTWREYTKYRGMSPWIDVVDWVGGYPFEVAKPEEILSFFRARGFSLEAMKTLAGSHGCNEFLLARKGFGGH
jgi:2-polyprenyl-6-hydroxyphenyl methylase/3-demethylubiquinone-9 3-methyltransferase